MANRRIKRRLDGEDSERDRKKIKIQMPEHQNLEEATTKLHDKTKIVETPTKLCASRWMSQEQIFEVISRSKRYSQNVALKRKVAEIAEKRMQRLKLPAQTIQPFTKKQQQLLLQTA